MIDSHATVGSCDQVSKRVYTSGAVRIRGVLKPPQNRLVIVEYDVLPGAVYRLRKVSLCNKTVYLQQAQLSPLPHAFLTFRLPR